MLRVSQSHLPLLTATVSNSYAIWFLISFTNR
jgi:hypothetical protein